VDRAALVRAAARNHVGWMEGLARAVTGGAGGRYDRVRWMEVRSGEVWVPFPQRPSGPAMITSCSSRFVRATAAACGAPVAASVICR